MDLRADLRRRADVISMVLVERRSQIEYQISSLVLEVPRTTALYPLKKLQNLFIIALLQNYLDSFHNLLSSLAEQ
jgi:hypothetical protein